MLRRLIWGCSSDESGKTEASYPTCGNVKNSLQPSKVAFLAALYRQWCRDTGLQFYSHLLDTVTVTHVAECLAVKLILPVLKSKISRDRDSNSRPSACVANARQTVPSMRPVMNYT